MPERKVCEVCGASDADNQDRQFDPKQGGVEIWSWTGKDGKFRCRCGLHVPRSRRRSVRLRLSKTPQ